MSEDKLLKKCKSTVNRGEDQLSVDVETEALQQRLVSCQVPSITIWGNIHHSDYVTKLGTLRRVRDSRSSTNTNTAKWLEEIGTEDTDLFPFPDRSQTNDLFYTQHYYKGSLINCYI